MSSKKREQYMVRLDYHKKGDDARRFQEGVSTTEGFLRHAAALEADAKILRRVAGLAKEGRIAFDYGDVQCIFVECDKTLGTQLIAEGVLHQWPDDEDAELGADAAEEPS